MVAIELNLEKITRISKQKKDENFRFRSFLKSVDDKKIDKIVHSIYLEVVEKIDCTKCANCCLKLGTGVTDKEIKKLSEMESLSQEYFESNFIKKSEYSNEKYLFDTPCRYLKDKKCSIYEDRPKDCKDYPHVHKKEFNYRTLSMIENLERCPIVFNEWEGLKEKFRK